MKKSIKDLGDIKGKRALVRVDVNVPLDENKNVTDDTRIRAILPTLKALKDRGAKVILMAHLGRPKGEWKEEFSPTSYAGGWDSNKKRPHTSRQVASETYFWQSMSRVFPYKSIKLKFPSHDV